MATETSKTSEGVGRYAYGGLDRLLHEKARLGIMTSLVTHPEGLLFNELKRLCTLTDGNLNRHLQALLDGALVESFRGVASRRPQTLYRLTALGQRRFRDYLAELERVIRDSGPVPVVNRRAVEADPTGEDPGPGILPELPPGWVPA